jgi:hypothetical protein
MRSYGLGFAGVLLMGSACGPKQVCECAVLAGGTAPASEYEAAYRSSAVDECLARHGGGTTTGCPQPAGMPQMLPPRQAPHTEAIREPGNGHEEGLQSSSQPTLICPDNPPATSDICSVGGRCLYGDTRCWCVGPCYGGAHITAETVLPPPRWHCAPLPPPMRADGCPGEPPHVGTPCAGPRKCSYSGDQTGTCLGELFTCSATWQQVQLPPLP